MNSAEKQLPMANEEAEQIALMRWAAYQEKLYPALKKLHHIPNGGSRGKAEAGRFKLMGVKPGVPDLFLPEARGGYHGLYIEMKRVHNGVVSAAQKGWIRTLRESGYRVEVCRGWVAASEVLKDYLKD